MEEEYLDVLQNIEFAIVRIYRADRNMIDADALDAVDALIRHYGAEENGRRPPEHRLAERPVRVFASVKAMCEWKLGRQKLAGFQDDPGRLIEVSILIKCLRQIHKSIRRWTEVGGRQGYLNFVGSYVP